MADARAGGRRGQRPCKDLGKRWKKEAEGDGRSLVGRVGASVEPPEADDEESAFAGTKEETGRARACKSARKEAQRERLAAVPKGRAGEAHRRRKKRRRRREARKSEYTCVRTRQRTEGAEEGPTGVGRRARAGGSCASGRGTGDAGWRMKDKKVYVRGGGGSCKTRQERASGKDTGQIAGLQRPHQRGNATRGGAVCAASGRGRVGVGTRADGGRKRAGAFGWEEIEKGERGVERYERKVPVERSWRSEWMAADRRAGGPRSRWGERMRRHEREASSG